MAREALLIAFVDALREPFRGELSGDLRALQPDLRNDRARQGLAPALVAEVEDALVEPGVGEVGLIAVLQVAADCSLAELDSIGEPAGRELGLARLARGVAMEQ